MISSIFLELTGYKPFVEACIDAGQKTEALKYIPKLTDPRERSEVYSRFSSHVIYKQEHIISFMHIREACAALFPLHLVSGKH